MSSLSSAPSAILIALLCLSACSSTPTVVPTTQVAAFGQAATALNSRVKGVIDEYKAAVLEKKFTDYAMAYSGNRALLLNSEELRKIEKHLDSDSKPNLAVYKANAALGQYFKSLSDLALAVNGVDVDLAAANLYGALISLNAQYSLLKSSEKNLFSPDQLAKFSSLTTAMGNSVVEDKRREALKAIVLEVDPELAKISEAISQQLAHSSIDEVLAASGQYRLTEGLAEYKNRTRDLPLDSRRAEIKQLYETQQSIAHSKLLVQQTQTAVLLLKESHGVLAKELSEGRFASAAIATAIGRLKDMDKYYDDFKSVLINCKQVTRDDQGILSCTDS